MRWTMLLLLAGCSAIHNSGVDEVESGDVVRDFRAPLRATWDATRAELEAREIEIRRSGFDDEDGGELVAPRGTVQVRPHHDRDYTRVRVQFAMFRDRETYKKVSAILDGVEKRLEESGHPQGLHVPAQPRRAGS